MTKQHLRVGAVRPSQVIHTFGIGALIDLPNFSAIVRGLESWDEARGPKVFEDRLLALVRTYLPQVEAMRSAPPLPRDARESPLDAEGQTGVPVSPFPGWVRCPLCDLIAPLDQGVFELKKDPWHPDKTRFVHKNCQKMRSQPPAVVPLRFARACEHGHLDDFPWMEFVHGPNPGCRGLLRLREFGVSAEAADIVVQCEVCNNAQPMTKAFSDEGKELIGKCSGRHPHLGTIAKCDQEARSILTGASNLWFSVSASALAIPTDGSRLGALVTEHWQILEHVKSAEVLTAFRNANQLTAFSEWTDEQLLAAIAAKRTGGSQQTPQSLASLKMDEWEVFSKADTGRSDKDFRIRRADVPANYAKFIDKVVCAERLRVAKAQVGFTRILSPGDYADVSEIPEVRRAPLSRRAPTWVPATEIRGEGVFIQFKEDVLSEWLDREEVKAREALLFEAHKAFRRARKIEPADGSFPGLRFTLIHTLSHALIRQFAIECGYGAASLTERIYAAGPDEPGGPMAGLLLYTAAADAEGTLGGLVEQGTPENLGRHLDGALEAAGLCASDPLCAEHEPTFEGNTLHGSACHACLFASETSCERGNKYLDRATLVEMIGGTSVPFFAGVLDEHRR